MHDYIAHPGQRRAVAHGAIPPMSLSARGANATHAGDDRRSAINHPRVAQPRARVAS